MSVVINRSHQCTYLTFSHHNTYAKENPAWYEPNENSTGDNDSHNPC